MCVVSMVGDHYRDKWTLPPNYPGTYPDSGTPEVVKRVLLNDPVSREEFNALKKDVEEMKALLQRAIEYDKRTGQEDCETDEKIALLRKVAKAVGVDIEEVFTKG